MFYRVLRSLFFLTILLAPIAARADDTQSAKPAAPRDLTTLRAEFPKLDATREAAKPHSKERAAAAQQAAQTASDIGWLLFEKGESAEAANWFARAAALRTESYEQARAYWQEYLDGEVGVREKTLAAKTADWQNQLAKATDPKKKQDLNTGVGALIRMRHIERYSVISMLEGLARDYDDPSALLEYSNQELEVTRAELADLQMLEAPAKEIQLKQSALAKSLERVADAQAKLAQFSEAEKNYQQALSIRRALPLELPERQLHETLSALGDMYAHDVGDMGKAREYYAQALQDFEQTAPQRQAAFDAEKTQDDKDMARAINALSEANIAANLGAMWQEAGDYAQAQKYYERTQQIGESLPEGGYINIFSYAKAMLRALALSYFADLHSSTGEIEKAQSELDEVIKIRREIGKDESTAGTLQEAARLHYVQGDLKTARRYVEQALLIFQQTHKLPSTVTATAFLATIARDENRIDDAAKLAEEAVPLARQSGNIGLAAGALRTLASVRLSQKRFNEATALLDEAARFDARAGSTLDQIATLGWQGQVLEAQGKNDEALEKYKSAVALLENIRASGGGEKFGETKSTAKAYERLVLLLIKMNRGEEAFDYMSRARSKQLQESLRLTSLKTNDKNVQALLDRASTLATQLQTTRGQLQSEQAKPAPEQDAKKIESLQVLVASTQGEYRRTLEKIKTDHPSYEKLLGVNPMQLKEAQGAIPDDTALVEFAPLENQFFIFVVTNENLKIFAPQISVDELWKRVKAVRAQITRPAQNPLPTRGATLAPATGDDEHSLSENLTALYAMLIAPIQNAVQDKSTLAFIPTQLLHYLPLGALAQNQNGKLHFLIEDKQVVYLSAADVMRVVRAQNPGKMKTGLVAFGDPTGANLPAARDEVLSIAKIFPGATSLTDAQVTKATVTDASTLQKRIVHFATHGILNANAPDQSYILLASSTSPENSHLTVGEVWDLPLQKVDLVTLSACETALAQGSPDGGEITTLAEAFSSAGAQSVVATLWSVADESTKAWMVEFYSQLAAGKPKAEAFRAAQLKLLRSAEYSHPYYWAPFILMGDWR